MLVQRRHPQLQASVNYAYEALNSRRSTAVSSIDGTGFVIPGTQPSRGLLTAGLGVQWPVGKAAAVYLSYDGLIGTGNTMANALNAGMNYRF